MGYGGMRYERRRTRTETWIMVKLAELIHVCLPFYLSRLSVSRSFLYSPWSWWLIRSIIPPQPGRRPWSTEFWILRLQLTLTDLPSLLGREPSPSDKAKSMRNANVYYFKKLPNLNLIRSRVVDRTRSQSSHAMWWRVINLGQPLRFCFAFAWSCPIRPCLVSSLLHLQCFDSHLTQYLP